ncbi:GlxA family transcriptional regulator [Caenispirillum bisanense]|uniref:Transcriptional regulator, AraC family with amidase-like domain n=1 Tax=Caenispirillum bisanense TaxID=414052 RepID=A0A286GZS9_9PROT|nr:DJ-1/PfpI family protein [Caenispirillum bisanense]SOE00564.1 transcriptional regulator, AraC family with amidase-like domain [Caenispirillum bisanense]
MDPSARLPRRIAILAPSGLQSLDLAGPLEVFNHAGRLAPRAYASPVAVVGVGGGVVTASSGLRMLVDPLEDVDPATLQTLVVAGGPGVHDVEANAAAVDWLRRHGPGLPRLASVCTGAYLLAAAGLLDGRRATTHWKYTASLARRYPAVRVEPDALFVDDGNIHTAAGVTAGIDLALALVEADAGRAVALEIARLLVVYLRRPGGQAQFSAALRAQSRTASERLEALVAWIADHLDGDLSVEALADQAGMSPRTLARQFTRDFGQSPGRYVAAARLDEARRLLLDAPDLPLATVAARVGLETAEGLRQAFQRSLGVAPEAFRRQFATARRRGAETPPVAPA